MDKFDLIIIYKKKDIMIKGLIKIFFLVALVTTQSPSFSAVYSTAYPTPATIDQLKCLQLQGYLS